MDFDKTQSLNLLQEYCQNPTIPTRNKLVVLNYTGGKSRALSALDERRDESRAKRRLPARQTRQSAISEGERA